MYIYDHIYMYIHSTGYVFPLFSKARDKWSRTLLCVTGPISLNIFLLCDYCFSVVSLVLGSTYTKPSGPVL